MEIFNCCEVTNFSPVPVPEHVEECFVQYLDQLDIKHNLCKKNNVSIQLIERDEVQSLYTSYGGKETGVAGFYIYNKDMSKIFIGDYGNYNEKIIVHEMAHFMFDIFCLEAQPIILSTNNNASEQLAYGFEKYYTLQCKQ